MATRAGVVRQDIAIVHTDKSHDKCVIGRVA